MYMTSHNPSGQSRHPKFHQCLPRGMLLGCQRGFTLIELIIFIVVVSAGLAGILSVMNTVVKSSADPMVRKQAIAVAESMLEEILLKEYDDPTTGTCAAGSSGERHLWDDVCDYTGYTSIGIKNPDATATAVAGLGNYNLAKADGSAGVVIVDPPASAVPTLRQVTVYVTGPQGTISLTGYRGNY
jgi:MSHA pilin protein MshD